jgi:hypothetical protein
MLKNIRNELGSGNVVFLILVMMVSIVGTMIFIYKEINVEIINYQKHRYKKAVDMAVKTTMSTIELNSTQSMDQISNLDKIALGYSLSKRVTIDKDKAANIFFEVLWKNIYGRLPTMTYDTVERKQYWNAEFVYFKKCIPLKAIVQYDTISVAGWDDQWIDSKLMYNAGIKENGNPDWIFLTLTDDYYRLKDINLPEDDLFRESNKVYFSINPSSPRYDPNDNPDPSIPKYKQDDNITDTKKGILVADIINKTLKQFISINKSSFLNYNIQLSDFDGRKFSSAAKDATFICLVEGIPISSIFSNEPDRSFYTVSFGGASIRRADE